MSGYEQAQPGGGRPVEWRGPEGPIFHDNIDYVLENVIRTGGVIPDTVHMTPRDRGVVLGAAAILGVRIPEATKRFTGRAERKTVGLTGKMSGDTRRTQIRLPSADDVAQSLELGETASGLIVAARLIENHKPNTLAPVRPIKNLGARALGGLTDLRNPNANQEWLRDVVDAVVGDAYGREQRRGRCLNGEGNAHSIYSPLLWARAVELTGRRGSADGALNAGMQNGFENALVTHRQYRDTYPKEVLSLYDDIQGARLAAQFDRYDLLHRILVRMRSGDPRPSLGKAAIEEGVPLTRENYRGVLSQLGDEITYMRQVLGLMNKDGMTVDQAVERLGRPVRAIPGEIRVHMSGAHAGRVAERRAHERAMKEQARARKAERIELSRHRAEVAVSSAAAYGRAMVADPAWNAEQARHALHNGDIDVAITHTMALAEQEELGMQGARAHFQSLWGEAAPRLLNSVLDREADVRDSLISVGEMRLIDRIDPNTFQGNEVRAAIDRLKEALREAAFAHYGLGTIYSPQNPEEPIEDGKNAVPLEHGGVYKKNDARAIRAGYEYSRLTAGRPNLRNPEQHDLYELVAHRWATGLLNAAEGSDSRALPARLNQQLQDIARWARQLQTSQRMQRIKDFWHLVSDPYASEWRDYLRGNGHHG